MTIGKGKRPRDPNQHAAWTVAVSTGQIPLPEAPQPKPGVCSVSSASLMFDTTTAQQQVEEPQFGLSDSAVEVPEPLLEIMRQNSASLADLTNKSHH